MSPLVSIICVSYNHERFVVEALESVKWQSYPNIELIIVDDGSQDKSVERIEEWLMQNPNAQFLNLKTNHTYCTAFNKAFSLATGEFYIDLAADDILLPNRVEEGVEGFLKKGSRYGVQFSDAEYIGIEGNVIKKHSGKFPHSEVKEGDVYSSIIHKYFICSPTMMVRKSILDSFGGYDERLQYEDFDLWVSAARDHLFFYIPEVLVQKRVVPNSLGSTQYTRNSKQLLSTYLVCEKIFLMNRCQEEEKSLNKRIWYELKWNLRLFHFGLVLKYLLLLLKANSRSYSN